MPVLRAAADPFESRPLRIIQNTEFAFPQDLLASGVSEGEVHAVLWVGARGELLDCLVTGYTHRELVPGLLGSVRVWEYEPALERGEPVNQRLEIIFTFRSSGAILSQTASGMIAATLNRKFKAPLVPLVCKPAELDRKPVVLESVAPLHPGKSLPPAERSGRAVIDFYIDSEGRPRMPATLRATNVAFAMAATDALLQWRFEPITSNGRPVAVRMAQEFIF